jgi:peptidyl-prolyl cis-trans isomerase SurA
VRRLSRSLPLLLLPLLLAVPSRAGTVIDRILVHVNSRIITQSQLDSRVSQSLRESGVAPDSARLTELKRGFMEELVNETLLEDRARDLDLVTTEAEIDEQVKQLKDRNQVASDEEFEKALAVSGLNREKLREQLRKSLTVQRVVGREVNSKIDLSDDALRLIYEREKETWRVNEQVKLAEILISFGDTTASRDSAEPRAREASDKLKAGMKFDTAVALYSDGPTKGRGGDLGLVSKGELQAEIERVAFSLPVGDVSDPIPSRHGWHIVKVTDKLPVSYKPFAEVKADLLKREQETQFQKKLVEYLDKLKEGAVIRVAQEAADLYTVPAHTVPGPSPTPAPPAKKPG